ncbi:hypothetical protein BC937DRAFT_86296 [Endogone sp. FLAS-F59071]|nr:hypothetical protein BC937DRAFT_86296 [Endogone sp. FLAS-F59071]|eukprot:RUS20135.1 hypothetical protein BC937DRAFT_86296 [Endogone sp. FLAS-F59071]
MNITLWVKLEDQRRPVKHDIPTGSDLDDFAGHLCQTSKLSTSTQTQYPDSGGDGGSLPGGIQLQHMKTSDRSPLVVCRIGLSFLIPPCSHNFMSSSLSVNQNSSFIVVVLNLKLLKIQAQITLTHSIGAWDMLLAQTRNEFDRLKDGAEFYFVDQKTKKEIIKDKITFNRLLSKTTPNDEDEIHCPNHSCSTDMNVHMFFLSLTGKKAYGDWKLDEVLNEILHKRYPSLLAIPELDIEQIKFHAKKLTGGDEATFMNNLKDIASSFHNDVNANEATARNFLNPFMHKAMLISDYPMLRLAVEEDFDGSRGYGFLDYVILGFLAILVTEAKMEDIQKGVTQNLVQLHTAAEKLGKRKREEESNINVYE